MKNRQDNATALPALLRHAGGVDTPGTNSLCCGAAGIIAPSSATAEALIPHEKLRGAALADATLNAQERPLAQPAMGYTHAPTTSECQPYWLDLNNIRPDQWLDPTLIDMPCAVHHTIEFGGRTAFRLLVTAAQKRIAELEQVNANLRECAVALNIDSDALNEQLLELLLEREKSTTQLATDTQLIEWLNQIGTYWDVSEFSSVSFPHTPHSLGFRHLRDAFLEAYQQDQARGCCMTSFNPHPITSAVKTQFGLDFVGEIRVDLFAGGGGATMGQEMGTGIPVDIAINHNPDAISMHKRNHPSAEHYITDVYDVCPRLATRGRPVAHLHASPECTHHSLAAGGQARSTTSRSQSWVIQKWGGQVSPRMITMENVVQILQWGPLIAKRCCKTGRVVRRDMTVAAAGERVPVQEQYLVPDPKRKGRTWRRFENNLRAMGYDLMYGKLKACDFGAATTRERLFLIARRDGKPLRWPEPTHFKNPAKGQSAYRTAASCIDWSLPCPSIFLTKEEGRAAGVKRPLVNNTMERLRKGAKRYVLEHKNPFIVSVNHTGNDLARCQSVEDPAKTITGAQGFALVTPQLAPFITEHANGGSQRNMPGDDPLRTICSGVKGGHFALAVAYVAQHNGGYNETPGHHPTNPLTAITTTGSQQQIVTAHLSTLRRNCIGRGMDELVPTITAGAEHHALVEYKLAPEVEAGAMRVAAFLMGYYGSDNTYDLRDPAATITTRDRLALVTVTIKGTPYVIVDIGMRMLTPRELYRAQGFPDNYVIDRGHDGRKFSNKTQVLMVGNSVSPWPMMALISANKDVDERELMGEAA